MAKRAPLVDEATMNKIWGLTRIKLPMQKRTKPVRFALTLRSTFHEQCSAKELPARIRNAHELGFTVSVRVLTPPCKRQPPPARPPLSSLPSSGPRKRRLAQASTL
jgi:hypothetical protein